ncbi:MAG: peptide chain release factor N(5)-glutamine methyltransferase [Lachnospiraceae bacterium]|nr:peptide chain release factor N(5)-glutamine methyltransferase [Lachnospiraceae bacterium]
MSKTYKDWYQWGQQELLTVGIEEAALDARLLLEYICRTDRNTLLVHGDRSLSPFEEQMYQNSIATRKNRIPLQHITGEQEFMGLTFRVNENVLIPRQDTEILVEEALRFLKDGDRILDVCTGSGCILLSLLHYSNECHGVGVDLSENALAIAKENGERLEEEAEWVCSDMLKALPKQTFELIVSNPPYIPTQVIPTLMEEVKSHEPYMALDGKEDGLYFYRKLVEQCPDYLAKEGMLLVEIGYDQAEAVSKLFSEAGFTDVTVMKDLAGLDRVVAGRK